MTTNMRAIFFDETRQIGKMYLPKELIEEIEKIAKSNKMSRSGLSRRLFEAFVMYDQDAKALGLKRLFGRKPSVTNWLEERNDLDSMSKQIMNIVEEIKNAKTPDEKITLIATQNAVMACMINLLHKTTMT